MQDNQDNEDIWLSPRQVSEQFDQNIRNVYRWMDHNEVAFKVVGRNKFINRDSVVTLMHNRQFIHVMQQVMPNDIPQKEIKEKTLSDLMRLEDERTRLITRLNEDARTIGELTEKTRHLDALETEVTGLRSEVNRLTAKYVQFRVLFWAAVLFLIVGIISAIVLFIAL